MTIFTIFVCLMMAALAYFGIRNALVFRERMRLIDLVHSNYMKHSDRFMVKIDELRVSTDKDEGYKEFNRLQAISAEMEKKMDIAKNIQDSVSYDDMLFSFKRFKNFYSDEDRAKMEWTVDI